MPAAQFGAIPACGRRGLCRRDAAKTSAWRRSSKKARSQTAMKAIAGFSDIRFLNKRSFQSDDCLWRNSGRFRLAGEEGCAGEMLRKRSGDVLLKKHGIRAQRRRLAASLTFTLFSKRSFRSDACLWRNSGRFRFEGEEGCAGEMLRKRPHGDALQKRHGIRAQRRRLAASLTFTLFSKRSFRSDACLRRNSGRFRFEGKRAAAGVNACNSPRFMKFYALLAFAQLSFRDTVRL